MSFFSLCLRGGVPADLQRATECVAGAAPEFTRPQILTALRGGAGLLPLRLDGEQAARVAEALTRSGLEARPLPVVDGYPLFAATTVHHLGVTGDGLVARVMGKPQHHGFDVLELAAAATVASRAGGVEEAQVDVRVAGQAPEPWLDLVFGPGPTWLRLPLARLRFVAVEGGAPVAPTASQNLRRLLQLFSKAPPGARRLFGAQDLERGRVAPEALPRVDPLTYYRFAQWLAAREALWPASRPPVPGATEVAWASPVESRAARVAPGASSGPRLERLRPRGEPFVLPPQVVVVGRSPAAHLRIDVDGVAPRHAQLQSPDGVLSLTAFAPTLVGGVPVTEPVTLCDGQQIQLGKALLRFRRDRPVQTESLLEDWLETPHDSAREAVLRDALVETGDPLATAFERSSPARTWLESKHPRLAADGRITVTRRGPLPARIAVRYRQLWRPDWHDPEPWSVLAAALQQPGAEAATELAIDVPALWRWRSAAELEHRVAEVCAWLAEHRPRHLRRLSLGYVFDEERRGSWCVPESLRSEFPRLSDPAVFQRVGRAELVVERPGPHLELGQRLKTRGREFFEVDKAGGWRLGARAGASAFFGTAATLHETFVFGVEPHVDVYLDGFLLRVWLESAGDSQMDSDLDGEPALQPVRDQAHPPPYAVQGKVWQGLLPGDRLLLSDGTVLRFELVTSRD